MPRQITAFSNPLVKQARGLRDKKNRRQEGLFLAEGLRILTEAREAGRLPEILFYSDPSHPLLRRLIAETETGGGEAIETNADILHKLSGKDNPQAVLG
ncbi:MAG: TrmH family RNA methyltransferase, partial [Allosphingosinicella sp.]